MLPSFKVMLRGSRIKLPTQVLELRTIRLLIFIVFLGPSSHWYIRLVNLSMMVIDKHDEIVLPAALASRTEISSVYDHPAVNCVQYADLGARQLQC